MSKSDKGSSIQEVPSNAPRAHIKRQEALGLSLAIRSSFLLTCYRHFGNLIKATQFSPSIPGRIASSAHLGE